MFITHSEFSQNVKLYRQLYLYRIVKLHLLIKDNEVSIEIGKSVLEVTQIVEEDNKWM